MNDVELSAETITEVTAFVDIEQPPPEGLPTAHLLFGTNQAGPVDMVADRYRRGRRR